LPRRHAGNAVSWPGFWLDYRVARIALVHDIAGVARVQAKLLRDAGHEVDQITLSEIGASWKWPVKAIAIPVRLASYLPAILRLRTNRYDVVHIHWLSQGIVGLLIGRPFFAQAHGSDLHANMSRPVLRSITRSVLEKATLVFYATPDLAAHAPGYEGRLRYLPNPVQVDETGIPEPPKKLARALIFTRLAPVKGVDQIFPAAERLRSTVELTALDWGPLATEYAVRYRGVVRFVRPMPREEVGAFLSRFDIVIGQMRQGSLGLSELEAMAAGGGPEQQLVALGAAATPDRIADAIEKLKDDEVELARLSRDGQEWVRRNHGFARHLRLLEEAYFGSAGSG